MNQPASDSANRRPEFVTLIAIYQFFTAAILFLLSCMIPIMLFPAILTYIGGPEEVFVSIGLATATLAIAIGFGFASIVVGYGLLRMKSWGRLGAIVLAAFALIGFPIWTVVAVLVLVYLTSDEAREAFNSPSSGPKQTPEPDSPPSSQAAYKTEPAPPPVYNPLHTTRPMTPPPPPFATPREGPATIPPDDVSHKIDPIPMPPSSASDDTIKIPATDPDSDTDSEQSPSMGIPLGDPLDDQPTDKIPIVGADEPPKRRWVRPPEEAGMDNRILKNDEQDGDDDPQPRGRQE